MDVKRFQTYICPQCGAGVVKFKGWGEDIHKTYYHVFECSHEKCSFQEWKPISFRDFPGDVPREKMFLAISPLKGKGK